MDGVTASGKRWQQAKITYDGKKHTIGSFKEEAALAYDRNARQYGKDKLLNYEDMEEAQVEHAPAQPRPEEAPKKRKEILPPGDGGGKRQHKGV
jgi:hypothetical protein